MGDAPNTASPGESLPAHSPLGASGAERWMQCPGSVTLLNRLAIAQPSDEPDYQRDGTTAHAGAAYALVTDQDAWEIVGHTFEGQTFTQEMAEAVQVYLEAVRECDLATADAVFVEHRVHEPALHRQFYGTVDCAIVHGAILHVFD